MRVTLVGAVLAAAVIGLWIIQAISRPGEPPVLGTLPEWSLTKSDPFDEVQGRPERGEAESKEGRTVSQADLKGRVWVADFIFTRCQGSCLRMSEAMASLRKNLPAEVICVSISVDPEYDTPKRLQAYSEAYGAKLNPSPLPDRPRGDESPLDSRVDGAPAPPSPARGEGIPKDGSWWWLTGSREAIWRLSREGFRLGVAEASSPPPPEQPGLRRLDAEIATAAKGGVSMDPFIHSTKFALVDGAGRIRGYFEGEDASERTVLVRRARGLAKGAPSWAWNLPHVNAGLNGFCALLLAVGWLFIKRRMVWPHKICMGSAFVVSMIFLTAYLTYHWYFGVTRFEGSRGIRFLYLAILGTHTLLAAAVPFLAVATITLALRQRWESHRRLAHWTLPVWMYVSVTGVVVYWMLYG